MKLTVKKLFAFILIWAFVFISCDDEAVNKDADKESKQGYLTITYHSEGHTEGEVPVDDTRYPIVATGFTREKDAIAPYRAAGVTIFGSGTLKKERYFFWGWKIKNPSDPDEHERADLLIGEEDAATGFGFEDDGHSRHFELHAIWKSYY